MWRNFNVPIGYITLAHLQRVSRNSLELNSVCVQNQLLRMLVMKTVIDEKQTP